MSKWKVGDECEGQFSEDEQWYKARVDKVLGDGKYFVTYTDYGNSEETEDQFLRPLQANGTHAPSTPAAASKYHVGQSVLAQFSEDNEWYLAVIDSVLPGNKSYHVKYPEYGNEEDCDESLIKPIPNWKVGDCCEAKFSEDGVWYAAEIKSINGAVFHVVYTEFGNEEDVAADKLRHATDGAAAATAAATAAAPPPPPVAAAPAVAAASSAPAASESGWGAPAASTGFGGFTSGFGSGGGGDSSDGPRADLVIRGLAFDTNEDTLRALFAPFGSIARCNIAKDRETGRSKGVGFVNFDSVDDATKAMEALSGTELDGRLIRVEYSQPRPRDGPGAGPRSGSSRPPPPLPVKSDAEMTTDTMFLGRMSYDTTEDAIRPLAEQFGRVISLRIMKDRDTGASKGSAHIQYPDKEAVKRAVNGMHGQVIDGRTVSADWARPSREFDANREPEPFTPKPTAPGGFGSSSSGFGMGGFGAAPAVGQPPRILEEAFDPKVLNPLRKIVASGSTFQITLSLDAAAGKTSGIMSRLRR